MEKILSIRTHLGQWAELALQYCLICGQSESRGRTRYSAVRALPTRKRGNLRVVDFRRVVKAERTAVVGGPAKTVASGHPARRQVPNSDFFLQRQA